MGRLKFVGAVVATSLVLVAAIVAVGIFAVPVGAQAAQAAVGNALWTRGMGFGPHGPGGAGFQLPPELQGLIDLAPADRFAHFVGVQVNLKDANNQPLTVSVVPGTVTAAAADSLTIAANDGTTRTFALNDKTAIHSTAAPGGAQTSISKDDRVVVVTLNSDSAAMAVVDGGKDGFGAAGPGGPWNWHR